MSFKTLEYIFTTRDLTKSIVLDIWTQLILSQFEEYCKTVWSAIEWPIRAIFGNIGKSPVQNEREGSDRRRDNYL